MDNQDNQLRDLALMITRHGVRISEIHRDLDNHVKFGSVPVLDNVVPKQPEGELTKGQIARILCNYPPNIVKAKKRLAHLPKSDPEYAITASNIETWSADLSRARSYKNEP